MQLFRRSQFWYRCYYHTGNLKPRYHISSSATEQRPKNNMGTGRLKISTSCRSTGEFSPTKTVANFPTDDETRNAADLNAPTSSSSTPPSQLQQQLQDSRSSFVWRFFQLCEGVYPGNGQQPTTTRACLSIITPAVATITAAYGPGIDSTVHVQELYEQIGVKFFPDNMLCILNLGGLLNGTVNEDRYNKCNKAATCDDQIHKQQ